MHTEYVCVCVCVCVHVCLCACSVVCGLVTPWTVVAHQAPLSIGFSRQQYWSELPLPSPGDLPNLGIEPESLASPALAGRFFTTDATWEYICICINMYYKHLFAIHVNCREFFFSQELHTGWKITMKPLKEIRLVKNPPTSAGDTRDKGSVPGSGRSPGEGNGNHASIIAWQMPWTEEPGGLQSMELKRVGHHWAPTHARTHTHTHTHIYI